MGLPSKVTARGSAVRSTDAPHTQPGEPPHLRQSAFEFIPRPGADPACKAGVGNAQCRKPRVLLHLNHHSVDNHKSVKVWLLALSGSA